MLQPLQLRPFCLLTWRSQRLWLLLFRFCPICVISSGNSCRLWIYHPAEAVPFVSGKPSAVAFLLPGVPTAHDSLYQHLIVPSRLLNIVQYQFEVTPYKGGCQHTIATSCSRPQAALVPFWLRQGPDECRSLPLSSSVQGYTFLQPCLRNLAATWSLVSIQEGVYSVPVALLLEQEQLRGPVVSGVPLPSQEGFRRRAVSRQH